jgi:hypothetical protein
MAAGASGGLDYLVRVGAVAGLLHVLEEPLSGLLRGNRLRRVLDTTNDPAGRSLAAHRPCRFIQAAWARISLAAHRAPREWVRRHPQEQKASPPARLPSAPAATVPVEARTWVLAIVTTPFGTLPSGSVSDLLTTQTLRLYRLRVNTIPEESSDQSETLESWSRL